MFAESSQGLSERVFHLFLTSKMFTSQKFVKNRGGQIALSKQFELDIKFFNASWCHELSHVETISCISLHTESTDSDCHFTDSEITNTCVDARNYCANNRLNFSTFYLGFHTISVLCWLHRLLSKTKVKWNFAKIWPWMKKSIAWTL